MKKHVLILFLFVACYAAAQEEMMSPKQKAQQVLQDWDTEHLLDSLDQEQQPRIVSGGVLIGPNISNYIIRSNKDYTSSHMKVGFDLGGFLDFRVTKHFVIQGQLLLTAERNYFHDEQNGSKLWSLGFQMPVYFLGRYGNMEKGYLDFGGGPFTHNVFASNLGEYKGVVAAQTEESSDKSEPTYRSLYENHSGLQAMVGYELPMGLRFMVTYGISLSDIASYRAKNPDKTLKEAGIYPQKVAIVMGYRWK